MFISLIGLQSLLLAINVDARLHGTYNASIYELIKFKKNENKREDESNKVEDNSDDEKKGQVGGNYVSDQKTIKSLLLKTIMIKKHKKRSASIH